MTRETKIGLLVGLAFCIVLGILISDHLSSTNEPLGAPLSEAASTLRSGLGQPGTDDVAPVLRAPQNVIPQQTVVTNEELNHHTAQPPVRFVAPPSQGQAIIPASNGNVAQRIQQIAQQHGEEIIPANDPPVAVNNTPVQVDPPAVKPAVRTYEAQPGDSLGAIALKAYGSSCRANREAIVAANPALAANRDLIVAGRTYTIPPLGNQASAATQTPQPEPEKPQAAKTTTYTVKAHDTLWSIAINEVGSPSAVAAIKELNQDVLGDSDRVRPNMKLTLPKKNDER